jgi:hypothetical protein
MCALVACVRADPTSTRRLGHLPGDRSTHALGKIHLRFANGTASQVHFLVSQLEYSRWSEVSTLENWLVEPLLRGLVGHFSRMGGVPLVAALDRPSIAGLVCDLGGPWDPAFAQAILDLGVGIEWLPGGRKNAKNRPIARLIASVKRSFFRAHRFMDRHDLQARLMAWGNNANTRSSRRTNGVAPAIRMLEERIRLRPLPFRAEDFALRIPVVVGPGPAVFHEGVLYPMPPESLGRTAILHLHPERAVIATDNLVVEHARRVKRS